MTPEQLSAIAVGDDVTLRESRGRVTQVKKTWFSVVWEDGVLETIPRRPTILVKRLHLETSP